MNTNNLKKPSIKFIFAYSTKILPETGKLPETKKNYITCKKDFK